jgi:hypothetical protein
VNRQALVNGYWRELKMGEEVSRTPGDYRLVFRDGLWVPGPRPGCHLIETVLLGEEGCSGDRLADAARLLGCSEEYLGGFVAGLGFAITPDDRPS